MILLIYNYREATRCDNRQVSKPHWSFYHEEERLRTDQWNWCRLVHLSTGPSIKNYLLYPYLPTLNHTTQNFIWHFWKIKLFFAPENHDFLTVQQEKEKQNDFFFLYFLSKILKGSGTANKQFFKDGTVYYWIISKVLFFSPNTCIFLVFAY